MKDIDLLSESRIGESNGIAGLDDSGLVSPTDLPNLDETNYRKQFNELYRRTAQHDFELGLLSLDYTNGRYELFNSGQNIESMENSSFDTSERFNSVQLTKHEDLVYNGFLGTNNGVYNDSSVNSSYYRTYAYDISPDGNYLVSGEHYNNDNTRQDFTVYDISNPDPSSWTKLYDKNVEEIRASSDNEYIRGIKIDPESNQVAFTTNGVRGVFVYNIQTGNRITYIDNAATNNTPDKHGIDWSPDGDYLSFVDSQENFYVYETENWTPLIYENPSSSNNDPRVNYLQFSNFSNHLFVEMRDDGNDYYHKIRAYDTNTWEVSTEITTGQNSDLDFGSYQFRYARSICESPTSPEFVIGGQFSGSDGYSNGWVVLDSRTLEVIDHFRADPNGSHRLSDKSIRYIDFTQDGRYMLLLDTGERLQHWDTTTWSEDLEKRQRLKSDSSPYFRLTNDGEYLINDRDYKIFKRQQKTKEEYRWGDDTSSIQYVALSDNYVAFQQNGLLYILDRNIDALLYQTSGTNIRGKPVISPDEKYVVWFDNSGYIWVYEIGVGLIVERQYTGARDGPSNVHSVTFDQTGDNLIMGDREGYLTIWETGNWTNPYYNSQRDNYYIYGVSVSPDNSYFLVGCEYDSDVEVFTRNNDGTFSYETRESYSGDIRFVLALDNKYVIYVHSDPEFRIYDTPDDWSNFNSTNYAFVDSSGTFNPSDAVRTVINGKEYIAYRTSTSFGYINPNDITDRKMVAISQREYGSVSFNDFSVNKDEVAVCTDVYSSHPDGSQPFVFVYDFETPSLNSPNAEIKQRTKDYDVVPSRVLISDNAKLTNNGLREYVVEDGNGNSVTITESELGTQVETPNFTSSVISVSLHIDQSSFVTEDQSKVYEWAMYVN